MSPRRGGRVMSVVVSLVALWAAQAGGCGGAKKSVKRAERVAAAGAAAGLIRHEFVMPALGGDFRVVVYCPDADAAVRAEQLTFARLTQLEQVFDAGRPDSDVSHVHANAGLGGVRISDDLYFVLKEGVRLTRRSDGAVDVTAGAYDALWRAAADNLRTLSEEDLAAADPLVGIDKLRLDPIGRTAHLTVAGTRLELSALVRGFACDRVLQRLARAGLPAALVDAGGAIAVGDPPPGAEGWRVEVTNAAGKGRARVVSLARRAIASSGRIGDVVALDGRTYSRVLNPQTGIGTTNLAAATVVARRAWQAAALARAAAVLGPDGGGRLVATVRDARVSFHAPPGMAAPPEPTPGDPESPPSDEAGSTAGDADEPDVSGTSDPADAEEQVPPTDPAGIEQRPAPPE